LGRVMALDVGTKTIGIALSDELRLFATLHSTVSRKGVAQDVARIAVIATEKAVDHVVVGLPYELDGSEERPARLARQIGEAVHETTRLPVTYIDERFSSVEAERMLIRGDMKRARRQAVIDQAAAAVILQSFLDHGDWTRDGEGA